jgi:hypothetical protein
MKSIVTRVKVYGLRKGDTIAIIDPKPYHFPSNPAIIAQIDNWQGGDTAELPVPFTLRETPLLIRIRNAGTKGPTAYLPYEDKFTISSDEDIKDLPLAIRIVDDILEGYKDETERREIYERCGRYPPREGEYIIL